MSLVKLTKDYEKNLFRTIKYFMQQKNLKKRVRLYKYTKYVCNWDLIFFLPK